MTRGNYACVSASNIKPLLEQVVNKHMAGYPPVIHYYDFKETLIPQAEKVLKIA